MRPQKHHALRRVMSSEREVLVSLGLATTQALFGPVAQHRTGSLLECLGFRV